MAAKLIIHVWGLRDKLIGLMSRYGWNNADRFEGEASCYIQYWTHDNLKFTICPTNTSHCPGLCIPRSKNIERPHSLVTRAARVLFCPPSHQTQSDNVCFQDYRRTNRYPSPCIKRRWRQAAEAFALLAHRLCLCRRL